MGEKDILAGFLCMAIILMPIVCFAGSLMIVKELSKISEALESRFQFYLKLCEIERNIKEIQKIIIAKGQE